MVARKLKNLLLFLILSVKFPARNPKGQIRQICKRRGGKLDKAAIMEKEQMLAGWEEGKIYFYFL
jgi:hypothetical protein